MSARKKKKGSLVVPFAIYGQEELESRIYILMYICPCRAGLIPSIVVYVVYVWRFNSCYNVLLVWCCLSIVIMGPSNLLHQLI